MNTAAGAPFAVGARGVGAVMRRVLLALVPGIAATVWFFGPGVLIQITLAAAAALAAEAFMLRARGVPVGPALRDGSALITAVLLALALPPLAPWWIACIGAAFAIVVAKHLYGGLGFNPFNPAMVGYIVLLVSFPVEMTAWIPPRSLAAAPLDFTQSLAMVLFGTPPPGATLDALTQATPLDHMKTQLALAGTVHEILRAPLFGDFGGKGWEWIANFWFLGGCWLALRRVIDWRIPAAMLLSIIVIATAFNWIDADHYPTPMFHVFGGATLLGAFFIATDPVTAATTPRGRWLYGAGIGVLTYLIRTFGGYPDGVAFAVVLMNLAVPLIDQYTQPRVFGYRR